MLTKKWSLRLFMGLFLACIIIIVMGRVSRFDEAEAPAPAPAYRYEEITLASPPEPARPNYAPTMDIPPPPDFSDLLQQPPAVLLPPMMTQGQVPPVMSEPPEAIQPQFASRSMGIVGMDI
jgi:hypothetical protein